MCGIVGYVGPRAAVSPLVEGLSRLEYRGYDSAGVAVLNGKGVETRKLAGRIAGLRDLLERMPVHGSCGIGHTRWATHGAPTERNAHPHTDCTGTIALVHNGIIENADVLRKRLEQDGHVFVTDTDTETLVHLIEESPGATLEERVIAALHHVEGTYGIAVLAEADPQKIVVARRGSPVLLGVGDGEFLVASDASAVLGHTRSVVYLNDGDVAVVTPAGYRVLDGDAREQERSIDDIEWDLDAIALGGYPHFMLKEICEQPETVQSTLRGRLLVAEGTARLNGLKLTPEQCRAIRRIVIVACGTSWHAGLVGRHVLEELVGIPVSVEYASEYRYRQQLHVPGTVTIAISQSGETADTLEALRAAKAAGSTALGLVNVVGSTIAREADGGIYLHAGPEIGVASTKAFTSQVVALLLLGLHLGRQRELPEAEGRRLVAELMRLPELVARTLTVEPAVRALAELYADARNALYLGRGINFPVALEGALKLKEISYVHAEGYPAAEMKHGPIALIDENMPVVCLAPKDAVYPKVISNMQEVKARGGRIIAITSEGSGDLRGLAGHQIAVPATPPLLAPVLTVIPLQLLAYHIAVLRGCDVDRPRNLAKSVTVE
ncbi:MAG: glutamine--fructose-6-phosphate transaminase (isomerizing) [Gemmatimonadetes bacterium]|nr:MAG: glutamine--fructose-6-phosphate transaminase (isomerizing) [Gemmatimonadota bacterium]PYP92831.1 MAG: glutamine--fructose-6-phosphate transaminase (isomerizing) [Gemmatimonadota bacterium]